jgi:hypothetical protein
VRVAQGRVASHSPSALAIVQGHARCEHVDVSMTFFAQFKASRGGIIVILTADGGLCDCLPAVLKGFEL